MPKRLPRAAQPKFGEIMRARHVIHDPIGRVTHLVAGKRRKVFIAACDAEFLTRNEGFYCAEYQARRYLSKEGRGCQGCLKSM